MRHRLSSAFVLTALLGAAALVASPIGSPAGAAPAVPVVTISVAGDQAQVSTPTITPGVVEFHVGATFKVPGPDGGPDPLSVVQTDHLDTILTELPKVFGDTSTPEALAASAQAIQAIHGAGTFYGGGTKGTVWRVLLHPGTYSVFGAQSTAMGMAKPTTFVVAGDARPGTLTATQLSVRAVGAVGASRWSVSQRSAPVTWVRFTNASHELHFMDMLGVKPGTTPKDVRKGLFGSGEPKFLTGNEVVFDVVSPGVTVAIKATVPSGRYLLVCFMPGETDGMPHALMGMWKLVTVR